MFRSNNDFFDMALAGVAHVDSARLAPSLLMTGKRAFDNASVLLFFAFASLYFAVALGGRLISRRPMSSGHSSKTHHQMDSHV